MIVDVTLQVQSHILKSWIVPYILIENIETQSL